jgi:hypothetical protein
MLPSIFKGGDRVVWLFDDGHDAPGHKIPFARAMPRKHRLNLHYIVCPVIGILAEIYVALKGNAHEHPSLDCMTFWQLGDIFCFAKVGKARNPTASVSPL